jgi:hypothetical protein
MDHEDRLYTRRHVERLIDGYNYSWSLDTTTGRPRWTYVPEPREVDPDPHAMWIGMLSALETFGNLESDGALTVLDLERGLHLMSSLHADAAVVISARVMLGLEDDEMDAAFPPVRGVGGKVVRADWRRLRDRAVAWLSAFLNGAPISSRDPKVWTCERAYRSAR